VGRKTCSSAGFLPSADCAPADCAHFHHVRTIKLWRGEFGPTPPFSIDDDTLIVGYSVWAELTCFLTLGWSFPKHIFDLHTAYLAASNVLLPHNPDEVRNRPSKDFASACRAYGLTGWENMDKKELARDIGEGRWHLHGHEACLRYCEEDVAMSVRLLQAQLQGHGRKPLANVPLVLHWSNYSAKAIALIQARGMPIDMRLWNAVQENRPAVIGSLLQRFDPSHRTDIPIYDPDGSWSYARFENWLASSGVAAWPRLETGRLDTDSDAFRLMYQCAGDQRPAHAARQHQRHRQGKASDRT
jgi:hypothetical protein